MQDYVKNAIAGLKKHRMAAYYLESREEVVPLLRELIPEGSIVSLGGSVTLAECGVIDELHTNRYRLIDGFAEDLTPDEQQEKLHAGLMADVMLASSNAITEDGYLYNVDGNSNRVAGMAYGPKSVILVCGVNKIVPTLDDAVLRVKTVAAPQNAVRKGAVTPCSRQGECISLSGDEADIPCSGCLTDQRMCCNFLISGYQRFPNRIKVILVNEELGY